MSDYAKDKAALRLMIAERGINGLLETIGDVCYDIAETKHNKDNSYGSIWIERGIELRRIAMDWNLGRRADRIKGE